MPDKTDYIIRKKEKGPLQRFKNQNLLLKKFGELGLKVYRAITGKRTIEELKKDLSLEDQMFYPVIDYMKETEMIELVPAGAGEATPEAPQKEEAEERAPKRKEVKERVEEKPSEELAAEETVEKEEKEEKEEEIEEETKPSEAEEAKEEFEEIEPIKPIEIEGKEEETEEKEEAKEKEEAEEEAPAAEEEKEETEEETEEKEEGEEEALTAEEEKEEEPSFSFEEPEESSVEKKIKDKYGDVGVRVYNLIDGQRTAEQIMREVGISETKLIEILDFLDKEGIIKLEYPGGKKPSAVETPKVPPKEEIYEGGFAPILETEKGAEVKEVVIPNPVEVPTKLPIDIVKSVQISANIFLKFKDEGKKVFGAIDNQADVIDIALKAGIPLYRVYEILNYLVENAIITLKPVTRDVVKKKYGDDAFTIYKKYGCEGLMLYELIGKDLSFKEMVDRTTKDKQKALEIFLFIHEVLGIELPLDKEILAKQIGL